MRFPMPRRALLLGPLAALFLPHAAWASDGRLTVFAAASLKNALDQIATDFATRTGDIVDLSYAGSSALARQIQQGAPADIFISANPDWMDLLAAEGRIRPETRHDLVGNRLVLVTRGDAASDPPPDVDPGLPDRLGDGLIAMALVEAVPAGIYGRQAFQSLGIWQDLASRVIQTDNVRAALALVSIGEAAFGVVYETDAAAEPGVTVAARFAPSLHPPIVYPVAVTDTADTDLAQAFLAHLRSAEAAAVFKRLGFRPLED